MLWTGGIIGLEGTINWNELGVHLFNSQLFCSNLGGCILVIIVDWTGGWGTI